MERTLIIYAHPNKKGFCGEILNQTMSYMHVHKKDFELIDLYAINYDPRLADDEHYTSGGYHVSDENKEFQKKITEATHLIFIYPTWWQNMPAILKGFVDRVFTSRFAFRYKYNLPFGLLHGRRAAVITSAGGPRIYTRCIIGDRSMTVLVKDVLRFCGMRARGFGIGSARELTEKNKKKIASTVLRAMRYLY